MKRALPRHRTKLDGLKRAMKEAQKRPVIGFTQGGSSRKNSGAKVAARNADVQRR
jgi:hypothetical protein